MCEQPETDMISGFFHGLAVARRVQAAFHFAALPFTGRLKTNLPIKSSLHLVVQSAGCFW